MRKKCSYCDSPKPLTREHIIPKWYYKLDPSFEGTGFSLRARGKIVTTELVIRDVCIDCNNSTLAKLDDYASDLFDKYFCKYICPDTNANIEYDYDHLVRWLLKTSYNSARSNRSDLEVLNQYREIILGKSKVPDGLILRLRTIAPATNGAHATTTKERSYLTNHPDWFRIGVFRVAGFDSMYWAFRHVTVNSYSFLICAPDLSPSSRAEEERQSLLDSLSKGPYGVVVPGTERRLNVPTPYIDSISHNITHLESFPFTYDLAKNPAISEALNRDNELVIYWIDRADIDSLDISNVLSFLNELTSSRETCIGFQERIELAIHGYDDDPRELWEIPEVIAFLAALDREWPYWILFQHPDHRWIQVLSTCLSNSGIGSSEVRIEPDLIADHLHRWFEYLNEICHLFAIGLTDNRRVSEQAYSILMRDVTKANEIDKRATHNGLEK